MSQDILDFLLLPCGGTAHFDHDSGCSHRCECGATVGSIGMPKACKEEMKKYETWEKLGGKGWNYVLGQAYE
jgi:hypothetical protein